MPVARMIAFCGWLFLVGFCVVSGWVFAWLDSVNLLLLYFFWESFDSLHFFVESLILAQDERWRRA